MYYLKENFRLISGITLEWGTEKTPRISNLRDLHPKCPTICLNDA